MRTGDIEGDGSRKTSPLDVWLPSYAIGTACSIRQGSFSLSRELVPLQELRLRDAIRDHARLPRNTQKYTRLLQTTRRVCKNTHNTRGNPMNSSRLIRMLEDDGWKLVRVSGSHHHFKHPVKRGLVTVPHPRKDLPIGTVKSILKTAGLN